MRERERERESACVRVREKERAMRKRDNWCLNATAETWSWKYQREINAQTTSLNHLTTHEGLEERPVSTMKTFLLSALKRASLPLSHRTRAAVSQMSVHSLELFGGNGEKKLGTIFSDHISKISIFRWKDFAKPKKPSRCQFLHLEVDTNFFLALSPSHSHSHSPTPSLSLSHSPYLSHFTVATPFIVSRRKQIGHRADSQWPHEHSFNPAHNFFLPGLETDKKATLLRRHQLLNDLANDLVI